MSPDIEDAPLQIVETEEDTAVDLSKTVKRNQPDPKTMEFPAIASTSKAAAVSLAPPQHLPVSAIRMRPFHLVYILFKLTLYCHLHFRGLLQAEIGDLTAAERRRGRRRPDSPGSVRVNAPVWVQNGGAAGNPYRVYAGSS
jgi:hypothetical protein